MPNSPSLGMMDIYSEYVKRRQSGAAMDDVIRELQPQADQLGRSERRQLGQLVQTWEANEGQHYKPIQRRPAEQTHQPPPGATPFSTTYLDPSQMLLSTRGAKPAPIRRLPAPPGSGSVIRPIEPIGPAADPDQRQICPNCGRPNHKKDSYCYSCGHILMTQKQSTKVLEEEIDAAMRWGTAHLGQSSTLLFWVRGVDKPIELAPQGELIVGRSADQSAMQPDIDLAAYNAENLGVSRLHAALKRTDNTVTITDLNSRNYTYINGQRLHSQEVRALRDGDEIRLGKLVIKVTFKHQIRRI
jgi:hypothetical protein